MNANLFRVQSRKIFSIGWIIVLLHENLYIIGDMIVEYSNDPNDHNILYIFLETFSRVYFDIFREFFLRCFDVTFEDFHGIRYACSVIDNYVNFVG